MCQSDPIAVRGTARRGTVTRAFAAGDYNDPRPPREPKQHMSGRGWKVKCVIDSVKATIPFQATIRRWKDAMLGYHRNPRIDANTIRDGLRAVEWLGDCNDRVILEVGSGWQPMIPIVLSLAGAR